MGFQEWLVRLRADGYRLCPASTGVPVEVRGLLPDGRGFHLTCRGVRVTLAVYRSGQAAWQVPVVADVSQPEEAVCEWERRPLSGWDEQSPGARLVFGEGGPDVRVVWDGGVERGWRGHEAGLLRAGEVAPIFARLLAAVDGAWAHGAWAPAPRARVSASPEAHADAVSWRSFQGV